MCQKVGVCVQGFRTLLSCPWYINLGRFAELNSGILNLVFSSSEPDLETAQNSDSICVQGFKTLLSSPWYINFGRFAGDDRAQ